MLLWSLEFDRTWSLFTNKAKCSDFIEYLCISSFMSVECNQGTLSLNYPSELLVFQCLQNHQDVSRQIK